MSRTLRKLNPIMKPGGWLGFRDKGRGLVVDGTPQHPTKSCSHNNRCTYCISNRTISSKRHKPSLESYHDQDTAG